MSERALKGRPTRMRGETVAAYGFLTPTFGLLGLFVLFPMVGALLLSFQKTDGFGGGTFNGLDNYRTLVSDSLFWRSALNTVLFTVLVTPLSMLMGSGIARCCSIVCCRSVAFSGRS